MGEKNIKRLYETLARILSKRENVKITVNVSKKERQKKSGHGDGRKRFCQRQKN